MKHIKLLALVLILSLTLSSCSILESLKDIGNLIPDFNTGNGGGNIDTPPDDGGNTDTPPDDGGNTDTPPNDIEPILIIDYPPLNDIVEEKKICDRTVDDLFSDDVVFVILQPYASQYRGLKSSIYEKIIRIDNILSIENGLEFPEEWLNEDGTLDETAVSPSFYRHYQNIAFNQKLKIRIKNRSKENILAIIKELEKIEEVKMAHPNYAIPLTSTSNVPDISDQWSLGAWNGINIEEAWDYTVGSRSVRVGVIDTGIFDTKRKML